MVLELDEQVRALTGRLVRLSGMGSWRGWGQVSILNLQSTGDIRLGCDPCVKTLSWRRAWHPTPGFWPGESHGQRSLAGCHPRGHKSRTQTYRNPWTEEPGRLQSTGLHRIRHD